MTIEAPRPDDPKERLFDLARQLHQEHAVALAVLDRIKEHVDVWTHDKRMRVAGEILLREIARFESEEQARAGA